MTTLNLLNSAFEKDVDTFEEGFNELMSARVEELIAEKYSSMFASTELSEEEEEDDEDEDMDDDEDEDMDDDEDEDED